MDERSQILITRSCPTVSSCFRFSSRSIDTTLCLASWNRASEGRLQVYRSNEKCQSIISRVLSIAVPSLHSCLSYAHQSQFTVSTTPPQQLSHHHTHSMGCNCLKHGSHTRTSNSKPMMGMLILFVEHLSQIALPQCRQWCCRMPIAFWSIIERKFQKKGRVHS